MISALRRAPLAALCAAALLAACGKGGKTSDTTTSKSDSTMAATPAPAPAAAPAPSTMTDPNIFAALDEANMADSTTGSTAAAKGTSADVRAFGRDMVRDHHALRRGGQDLAKKLNISPAAPPGDNSAAADKALADSLTAMAKGPAWDKFYIDHAVTHHQVVLATAQTAMSSTQNADVKAMLAKAAPIVQQHLDKARTIQGKLGGTATTDSAAAAARKP
jgi:putative membrane protein